MAVFNDDKINGIWQEVMPANQKSDFPQWSVPNCSQVSVLKRLKKELI
jgi:hypothetical protein